MGTDRGGGDGLRGSPTASDLEKAYRAQRELLRDGARERRERREGLSELVRRMEMMGQRTEDDLLYTMRNLGGDAAVDLGRALLGVQSDGEEARRIMRREMSTLEEEEEADRRRIERLDDEYAIRRKALLDAEDDRG